MIKMTAPILAASALLITAGTTLASPPEDSSPHQKHVRTFKELRGQYDQPLHRDVDSDEDSIEITINDDQIHAIINGKEIDPDRIKRTGNKIIIFDNDGNKITEFSTIMPATPNTPHMVRIDDYMIGKDMRFQPDKPKVMVGITMAEPDSDRLADYDFDPENTILISRVLEGLPADRAGLKKNDIIIKIDGKHPASLKRLQKILLKKTPGDELNLIVLRDNKRKKIVIELAPRDPQKLTLRQMSPDAEFPGMRLQDFSNMDPESFSFKMDMHAPLEAIEALNEALEKLHNIQSEIDDIDIREALSQALESLEVAKDQLHRQGSGSIQEWVEQLRDGAGQHLTNRFKLRNNGEGKVLIETAPSSPDAPKPPAMLFRMNENQPHQVQAQADRRIVLLNKRMDKLDQRLDHITELLERIAEDND